MTDKILLKGNEALAEAAILAGCKYYFGYPITPQTELSTYMAVKLPKLGGTFLQAESEIAAANMVLGAASAGVRTMTSSSSPGISLKTECLSYLAGSDLPCLIVNVQRCGPGLAGILPAQGDYFQATKAPGHGDFHILVYAPASVQEMADMVFTAFDCSEKYRVPAMILSDGVLGQMMEPVSFPTSFSAPSDKPWATNGHKGKRFHNVVTSLHLDPADLERSIVERYERYALIEAEEAAWEEYLLDDADIILTAYGASARIARSIVDMGRAAGLALGLLRPKTLWPFPKKVYAEYAKKASRFMVIEMSMGQMLYDVQAAVEYTVPVHFYGRTGGILPSPKEGFAFLQSILEGV